MNEIAIDLVGFEELKAAWGQAPEIVREELLGAMTEADALLLHEISDLTPKASGLLRGSEHAEEKVGDEDVIGMVSASISYAIPVELGTKPHDITATGSAPLTFMWHGQLVHFRKVHHPGTQGAHMFERGFQAARPEVERIFEAGVGRILARLGGAA